MSGIDLSCLVVFSNEPDEKEVFGGVLFTVHKLFAEDILSGHFDDKSLGGHDLRRLLYNS